MARNEWVDTSRDADHAEIGSMDIARSVMIALSTMRYAFVPLKELRQPRKIRLPRQQMDRLHRLKVTLPQRLLRPPLSGKARGRKRGREKARHAIRVDIDKYWLV